MEETETANCLVVLRFICPSLFQLLHLKLFEISRGNLIAWHKCLHKDFNPNSKNLDKISQKMSTLQISGCFAEVQFGYYVK